MNRCYMSLNSVSQVTTFLVIKALKTNTTYHYVTMSSNLFQSDCSTFRGMFWLWITPWDAFSWALNPTFSVSRGLCFPYSSFVTHIAEISSELFSSLIVVVSPSVCLFERLPVCKLFFYFFDFCILTIQAKIILIDGLSILFKWRAMPLQWGDNH